MSECIAEIVVIQSQPSEVVVQAAPEATILEVSELPNSEIVVIQSQPSEVITEVSAQATVLEVSDSPQLSVIVETLGVQGMPGPRGLPGEAAQNPINPVFTYTSGKLTRIDYDSGAYKIFTYTSGKLTQIQSYFNSINKIKTLNYLSGILTSIDEVVL